MLWTDKHAPNSCDELCSSARSACKGIKLWLTQFSKDSSKVEVACLVCGSLGVGKTLLVNIAVKESGYSLVELDPAWNQCKIKEVLCNRLLYSRRPLLLVEAADACGSLSNLTATMQHSKVPIVLIANDKYASNLKSIQRHCRIFSVEKPSKVELRKVLSSICNKEGFELYDSDFDEIAHKGDLQQALSQLQLSDDAGQPDSTSSAFLTTHKLLSSANMKLEEALETVRATDDKSLVSFLLQENYVGPSCKDMLSLAKAAEWLSVSDIMERQHSETADACLVGCATSVKVSTYPKFPQYLGKQSTATKNARLAKSFAANKGIAGEVNRTLVDVIAQKCKQGKVGIEAAAKLAKAYKLNKTDLEDLQSFASMTVKIGGSTKAALTRTLNK